ncbi:DUF4352 domain-containing protein [uncultured Acetatifactor sp.]|uniref:DUF4352 domain-containing protein n=1 Tax=uncultured Acetatifactor sp. TaxID=1671927 RepID=UPI002623DA7C|nr:DUF4352 domain-containing protein [uncultured Acetatifactor sp.]
MAEKKGTKLCKHCKTEIPAGAKVCPNCRKKQSGVLKWIIIAFVAICIIGAASGGSDDKPKESGNTNRADNTQSSKDGQTEKSSESKQEEPEQKDKYYVGDTWENKYVLVSYDECGEYVSDNQFIQPAAGNKFVYATFTFENVGSSDTTVGYWDFDCYADGYACEGSYGADDSGFTQTLSSGRKITGSVYFEVPENAGEIEFEYSPSFWSSEKIVFVYQ